MLVFPNIKINLGLRILDKRSDGFHNLETIFYPVAVCDLLELVPSNEFSFTQTGLELPAGVNLCIKAWQLLQTRFPQLPATDMYLHKLVPTGAGLGGGSSDGAHVLLAANQLFQLKLSEQELIDLALQLGSDCPFFIFNNPCIAHGRGEVMQLIDLNIAGDWIILVHAGIHISTAGAFAALPADRNTQASYNVDVFEMPAKEQWLHKLTNDFESPAFKTYPTLKAIRDMLLQDGAYYAAMSGSGSTVFGLFQQEPTVNKSFISKNYWVKKLQL